MARTVYVPEAGGALKFADGTTDQQIIDYVRTKYAPTPVKAPEQAGIGALEAGLYGFRSRSQAAFGKAAQGLGWEDTANLLFEQSRANEELASTYKPDVANVSDIKSASDVAKFAGSTLGQSATESGVGLAGAYAGAVAGASVGSVVPFVGTAAGGIIGGIVGGAIAYLPSFVGGNLQRQVQEQGTTLEEASGYDASMGAIAQAPLDAAVDALIARKLPGGGAALDIARKSFFREVARTAAESALANSLSEPAQQAIEIAQANPEKLLEFSPDVQNELLNAAAGGAIAGGVIGGAAGGVGTIGRPTETQLAQKDLAKGYVEAGTRGEQMKKFAEINAGVSSLASQNVIGRLGLGKVRIDPTPANGLKAPIERYQIVDTKGNRIAEFSDPVNAADAVSLYNKMSGKKLTLQNFNTSTEVPVSKVEVKKTAKAPVAPKVEAPAVEVQTPSGPEVTAANPFGEGLRSAKIFKTSLGSQYAVHPDGSTTRYKTPHPGHDPNDVGLKPKSQRTFYIRSEDAANLSLVQAQGLRGTPIIDLYKPGVVGVRIIEGGADDSKFVNGTLTKIFDQPEVGLSPVEIWSNGAGHHFGNKITEIIDPPISEPTPATAPVEEAPIGGIAAIQEASPDVVADVTKAAEETPQPITEPTEQPAEEPIVTAEDQERVRKFIQDRKDKVATGVREALARYNLKDVQTKFVPAFLDAMGRPVATEGTEVLSEGKSLVKLATDIYDPNLSVEDMVNRVIEVLNHESIHSLFDLGLIRPAEKAVLMNAVASTRVPGKLYTYLDMAKKVYDPSRPGLEAYTNPDMVAEEAIAEMFRDWRKNNKGAPPNTRGLFNRIIESLRHMFNVMKRNRYEDVFTDIASGKLGSRERAPGQKDAEKFSVAPPVDSEEFSKWFDGSVVVTKDGKPMVMYHGTDTAATLDSLATPSFFTDHPDEASAYTFWKSADKRQKVLAREKYKIIPGSGGINITRVPYVGIISDIPYEDRGKVYATDQGVVRVNENGNVDIFTGWVVDYNSSADDYEISIKRGDSTKDAQKLIDERNEFIDDRYPAGVGENGRVYPVYLSIKNPIKLSPLEANRLGARLGVMSKDEALAYIANLEAQGYDGIVTDSDEATMFPEVYDDLGRVPKQYIPFRASQVKSIFNRFAPGTSASDKFSIAPELPKLSVSPEYPFGQRVPQVNAEQMNNVLDHITYGAAIDAIDRIVNSRTGKVAQKFMPEKLRPTKEGITSAVQIFADKMIPVGQLVDYIKQKGGYVPDAFDTYLQEELMHGKVSEYLKQREDNLYKPLIEYLRDNSIDQGAFEDYLYARHAVERNEFIRDRNPGADPELGSGMSDKDAKEIINSVENSAQRGKILLAEEMFRRIIDDTNQLRREGGLTPDFDSMTILDEDGNEIPMPQFKAYAPLRGFADESMTEGEVDESLRARIGQGLKIRGREDMRAMGRKSRATDIIAHAMLQNTEALVRAEKNKVGQSLLSLIEANPQFAADYGLEVMTKGKKPLKRYVSAKGVVKTMVDPMYKNSNDVLVVKRAGEEIPIRIDNPFLQKALITQKSGDPGMGERAINVLQKMNRWLASVNTVYNPEFMLVNFPRDLQTAMVNITQYEIDGIQKKVLKDALPAAKSVWKMLRDPNEVNEWTDWYNMFKADGGQTAGFYGSFSIEDRIKEIEKMANDVSGQPSHRLKQSFDWVKGMLEDTNGAFENAVRLSVYKNLVEAGLTRDRAAQAAKNLTVNFDKRGTAGPLMNSLYLFYNASIQGSMAMLMAGSRSKRVRKIIGGIVVAGVMQDMVNNMFSPEDEDKKKLYDKIPEYKLQDNIIIMDPFGFSKSGYYAIPLPYGFNAFYNMGRALSRNIRGGYKTSEAANSILLTFTDAFNPIGGTENIINFIAPTALDPLVAIYGTNRDNFGRRIAPEPFPGTIPKANSQMYWSTTSPIFTTVADYMNWATGGTEYVPGWIDKNPAVMEYMFDYVLGATGAFARRMWDTSTSTVPALLTGDFANLELNNVPVLRKLYGNVSSRVAMEGYFDNVSHVLARGEELKSAMKEGNPERIRSVRARFKDELAIYPAIKSLASRRNKLAGELKKVRENPKIPADAKRRRIEALQKQIDQVTGRVNKLYEDKIGGKYPSLFS